MPNYPGVDQHGRGWRARWDSNRQSKSGFDTAREAYEFKMDREAEMRDDQLDFIYGVTNRVIPEWTMGDAFDEWIETLDDLAVTTITTRRRNWDRHLAPTFAELHPRRVTPDLIKRWQSERVASGCSVTSVRGYRSNILSGMFKWMVANRDRTMLNPVVGVAWAKHTAAQLDRGEHLGDPTRVLSPDEFAAFYEAMVEVDPRYCAMLVVGNSTGLRPAEVYGLRPSVVRGGERPVISVERAIVTVDGISHPTERLKGEPKSRASRRLVDVDDILIKVIEDHIAEYGLSREGYIFSMPNGSYVHNNAFINRSSRKSLGALVRAARLAGLEEHDTQAEPWKNIIPYTWRHTNISMRQAMGHDLAYTQQQVGHQPGSPVTYKNYVRVVPGIERVTIPTFVPRSAEVISFPVARSGSS
jgi:integrase